MSFTFGLVARKGIKGTEDADVVKHMRNAGAILLGVSNVPELNLWCEARNMLFGQTLNPYNLWRTVCVPTSDCVCVLSLFSFHFYCPVEHTTSSANQ